MKSSTVSDSAPPSARNASALRSTNSRTPIPAAPAASTFLSALSSVPAWNRTAVAAAAVVAREHVGLHELERVPDVRARVHVRMVVVM